MADERPGVRVVAEADLEPARLEKWADERRLRQGFALPTAPWDLRRRQWICVGTVTGPDDAEAALTALVRGVGLVIAVQLSGDRRRRFLEDLRRAGSPVDAPGNLDGVQLALLDALATGKSMIDAAAIAHVSRRTAHRRMAEIRARYGVDTTAEAVLRWLADDPHRAEAGQDGGRFDRES